MKMKFIATLAISAIAGTALLLASCGKPDPAKMASDLTDADRAFSKLSLEKGINAAFKEFVHDDGVVLRPGKLPIIGKNEVVKFMSQSDDSEFSLTWLPQRAEVSASGDMGYTFGLYELRIKASGNVAKGTYASVWKKDKDGKWKFVLDTGNEGIE